MPDGTAHDLGARPVGEMRGEWPGGWKEDAYGNLAFTIRGGCEAPVWACTWCKNTQLHTLAEHEQILRLAAKT